MATEDINIIDPDQGSGYDYISLNLWEDGEDGNLVTADKIAVAKCRCTGGTADTTAVTISGWTTDATRYIKIWTDPSEGYRHSGRYETGNKYRHEVTGDNNFSIYTGYVRFHGIQAKTTSDGIDVGAIEILYSSGAAAYVVDSCILVGAIQSDLYCDGIGDYGAGANPQITRYIINTIIYDCKYATSHKTNGVYVRNGYCYLYNCTLHNNGTNLRVDGGTCVAKNCGFLQGATANQGTITQTTCSTSSPTFVNEAGDDFHLSAIDTTWKGQGTNLTNDAIYPFKTDIDGQTRPASGAWCIGADEYVKSIFQYLLKSRKTHLIVR